MNREEILAKAKKETDERELVIKNKAYKYAAEVATTIMAFVALYLVVDGMLLENVRTFDGTTVGAFLAGVGTIYIAIYEGYTGYHLKNKVSMLGCALIAGIAAMMFKFALSGIL